MISLPGMIERAARLNSTGIATSFGGREHSWSEVQRRIACLAAALQTFQLDTGDRIAVLSLNSDRYYESTFAIPWGGYCLVPLNTRWALPENKYAVGDSGTRVLLFDDAFVEQAGQLLSELDTLEVAIYMGDGDCPEWALFYEALIAEQQPVHPSARGDDDMAGIFYTGGTTGFPKGVMQSHRAIWASAVGALPDFIMNRDSVYLHVAPMFHMADFAGSMGATLSGGKNVVLQAFDAGQVLQTFAQEKITHVLLVPAMVKMLLHHPDAASADLSSVKTIIYGASPMPEATLEQCMALWPSVGLAQAYGQTELAPVSWSTDSLGLAFEL